MWRLFALSLVLGLTTTGANAQVIDIAWDDMGPGCTEGRRSDSFACNSGAAANNRTIITTFVSPMALSAFVGMTSHVRLATAGDALPNWWRMGPGECRSNGWGAVFSPAAAELTACSDPWGAAQLDGHATHVSGDGGANRARILFDLSCTPAQVVEAGMEYYGQLITLAVLRTTGTGSCQGCVVAACLLLERIDLFQEAGSPGGDVITLQNPPGVMANLFWRGGIDDPVVCPGATPARANTWGEIKALYR